jgi:hypothetical protein
MSKHLWNYVIIQWRSHVFNRKILNSIFNVRWKPKSPYSGSLLNTHTIKTSLPQGWVLKVQYIVPSQIFWRGVTRNFGLWRSVTKSWVHMYSSLRLISYLIL